MAIKLFLSYSSHDRKLAGKIKTHLEPYGFDVFLAHETIEPSLKWQKVILEQLKICKVFVALLTEEFDESNWTHQEVGIALGRGGSGPPIMVPIDAGEKPVGFLAEYQAIHLDPLRADEPFQHVALGRRRIGPSHMESVVQRIVKIISSQDTALADEIRGSLIERMADVTSFDAAGFLAWALADLDGLSPVQVNRLLKLAATNVDVYGSGSAAPYLRELIEDHRKEIKKSVLRAFQNAPR